ENITYYARFGRSRMPESEFVARVVEKSGARLLLDVNNVFVNSVNFGFDPRQHMSELPLDRVVEIHVAGHSKQASGLVLDTHGTAVSNEVFELLAFALERTGPVPVLLERDNDVPELDVLLEELRALRTIYERATAERVNEVSHASA